MLHFSYEATTPEGEEPEMPDRADIQMVREAKAHADAEGTPNERLDVTLALYEAGFSGWGPEVDTETLKSWLADPTSAPKSASRVALESAGAPVDDGTPKVRRGGEPASNQFGTFAVHDASPKQVAFIKRLLGEKDYEAKGIKVPADLDTIGKKAASTLIDKLMGCADKAAPATAKATGPRASDKQMDYLRKLIAERDYFSLVPDDRRKVDYVNGGGIPTPKGASALIDVLKVTAYATGNGTGADVKSGSTGEALELGMYRKADGTMYRVYPARQSDRILAKRLVSDGEGGWEFEYAGMASRFVKADEKMTLEEAKAWGAQFGTCCVCAALLSDPVSVAAGIGPKCAQRV